MTKVASAPFAGVGRLRAFVLDLAALMDRTADEAEILEAGGALLADLVAVDDWLPEDYAQPDPERYRQYLLHCDSAERFSVVSFVWGPGQSTPIHDHTVWGLVGVLRGAERTQFFHPAPGGLAAGPVSLLEQGQIERLSPRQGDIHQVANAIDDRPSISVHVYGANIGAVERSVFTPQGERKAFISGYSNTATPNLWDVQANMKRS